jgi:hypothetical protein
VTALLPVNREAWLLAAVDELRPVFGAAGFELPATVRVSCGWPARGATSASRRCIGECWYGHMTADGVAQLFISPSIGDHVEVLATLVHELAHAALPVGAKHGPKFASAARRLRLDGKPTATVASPELAADLITLAERIGSYPHAIITPGAGLTKQSTRMLKVECPECGYTVRTSAKWLEVGVPTCPCGVAMEGRVDGSFPRHYRPHDRTGRLPRPHARGELRRRLVSRRQTPGGAVPKTASELVALKAEGIINQTEARKYLGLGASRRAKTAPGRRRSS